MKYAAVKLSFLHSRVVKISLIDEVRHLRHPPEGSEDGRVLRRQHDGDPGDVQARCRAVHRHVPPQGFLALVHGRGDGPLSISLLFMEADTKARCTIKTTTYSFLVLPTRTSSVFQRSLDMSIQHIICRSLRDNASYLTFHLRVFGGNC